MGTQDLENAVETGDSLRVPYKDIHVRHCPLHAAAPDLLAACKSLIEAYGYRTTWAEIASIEAIRKAIAKAEGGAA